LISEATGEIELDEKILVIKRIHVKYALKLEARKREAAERAHEHHIPFCPVARTIRNCVDITTSLKMEDL
jgi:organic hydroperoxide reductase OsmC/OhrA